MKTITKLIPATLGILLASLSLIAAQEVAKYNEVTDYQLPEYQVENITPPIATKVVMPRVSRKQIGREVSIYFKVNSDGRATKVHSRGHTDQEVEKLVSSMRGALRYWRFEPALDLDGNAISVDVELPVRVSRNGGNTRSYASVSFASPAMIADAKF